MTSNGEQPAAPNFVMPRLPDAYPAAMVLSVTDDPQTRLCGEELGAAALLRRSIVNSQQRTPHTVTYTRSPGEPVTLSHNPALGLAELGLPHQMLMHDATDLQAYATDVLGEAAANTATEGFTDIGSSGDGFETWGVVHTELAMIDSQKIVTRSADSLLHPDLAGVNNAAALGNLSVSRIVYANRKGESEQWLMVSANHLPVRLIRQSAEPDRWPTDDADSNNTKNNIELINSWTNILDEAEDASRTISLLHQLLPEHILASVLKAAKYATFNKYTMPSEVAVDIKDIAHDIGQILAHHPDVLHATLLPGPARKLEVISTPPIVYTSEHQSTQAQFEGYASAMMDAYEDDIFAIYGASVHQTVMQELRCEVVSPNGKHGWARILLLRTLLRNSEDMSQFTIDLHLEKNNVHSQFVLTTIDHGILVSRRTDQDRRNALFSRNVLRMNTHILHLLLRELPPAAYVGSLPESYNDHSRMYVPGEYLPLPFADTDNDMNIFE